MASYQDYEKMLTSDELSIGQKIELLNMLREDTEKLEKHDEEIKRLEEEKKSAQDEARKAWLYARDNTHITENPPIKEPDKPWDDVVRDLFK